MLIELINKKTFFRWLQDATTEYCCQHNFEILSDSSANYIRLSLPILSIAYIINDVKVSCSLLITLFYGIFFQRWLCGTFLLRHFDIAISSSEILLHSYVINCKLTSLPKTPCWYMIFCFVKFVQCLLN